MARKQIFGNVSRDFPVVSRAMSMQGPGSTTTKIFCSDITAEHSEPHYLKVLYTHTEPHSSITGTTEVENGEMRGCRHTIQKRMKLLGRIMRFRAPPETRQHQPPWPICKLKYMKQSLLVKIIWLFYQQLLQKTIIQTIMAQRNGARS